MHNLFSIFDPSSSWGMGLNWATLFMCLLLPSAFWLIPGRVLAAKLSGLGGICKDLSSALFRGVSASFYTIVVSTLMLIMVMNFMALLPYVFSPTSHLVVTLSLGLPAWVGYITWSHLCNPSLRVAHLVPSGTPLALIPFMVVIEVLSAVMRPLTLSIRLAANMVAGHLLMALVSGAMSPSLTWGGPILFLGLLFLMVLETGVSLIQAYVFATLYSLYLEEVSTRGM